MRAAALMMAAALVAPGVLAQQTQPGDEAATVAQPRFEAGAASGEASQGETEEGGRFRRAPSERSIEVTPLAPPGGAGNTLTPGSNLGEITPPGLAADEDPLPERGEDGVLPEPGQSGPVFRQAPETGSALARPNGVAIPIEPPETQPRAGVRLRELDKMTGQTETFELAVGDTRQVDRLKIRLEACRSPETNDTHGTIAFLKVWDIREPDVEVFSGWMFAQSPSLSAIDHPRYDLWVISCTTSDLAESSRSE